jgi:hypothetical protein
MLAFTSLEDFHDHVKEYENGYKLDLSSSEDLSIALMNLISVEEHLFFSAQKTGNENFIEILSGVRQIRKQMQGELVHDTQGEVWCICKHLLATTMRLMETGTKIYAVDKVRAGKFFQSAGETYNLFWALNLKLFKGQEVKAVVPEKSRSVKKEAEAPQTPKVMPKMVNRPVVVAEKKTALVGASVSEKVEGGGCKWKKFSKALNENLDCCHE